MPAADGVGLAVAGIALVVVLLGLLTLSVTTIRPYEVGVETVFGQYRRQVHPGFHLGNPLAKIQRVDLREQLLDVPPVWVNGASGNPTSMGAVVRFHVADAAKAVFCAKDYVAQTRAVIQSSVVDGLQG
jgi:regulator of protease activity HflC (stomatin/prohibitin superfamily)